MQSILKHKICVTEVRADELERLRPDIAALYRLRGLPERMFHQRLKNTSNQR